MLLELSFGTDMSNHWWSSGKPLFNPRSQTSPADLGDPLDLTAACYSIATAAGLITSQSIFEMGLTEANTAWWQ